MNYCTRILFSLAVLLSIALSSRAQNCIEKIDQANKLIEAKEYPKSIALVQGCTDTTNSKSVRWQAYRILAISYVYTNKNDSATWASQELLKIYPGYVPDKINNPIALRKLTNEFVIVKPKTIYTNFFLGTATAQPHIIQTYALAKTPKTYVPYVGFQLGMQVGVYLHPQVSVELGARVFGTRYAIQYDVPDWKLTYQENQLSANFPLAVQYIFNPQKRLRYAAKIGAYKQYLFLSENNFYSTYWPTGANESLLREISVDRRTRWNTGYSIGFSMMYKVGNGHLNFEASYLRSTTQYNKPETRFDTPHVFYNYFYVDDDLKMDHILFSIGYTHLFHKAIKKFE
ncbi:MAG: hypothetical protein CFE21_04120 [Bacteroidetes bacterium B1(2017)]|nr:MAG: hypothetical protein CFE21_04120 [Bacteroidetes bacterium B1(2017)]